MPIPPNPTFKLHFTGLVAFCFGAEFKYCQVGIHTRANGHEVRVSVYKKRENRIVSGVPALTLSHEMIRCSSDLWLDVEGETPPRQQTASPYIVDDQGAALIDDQDFRHVPDLEGENFYNRPLKIKDGILTPSLFIGKGLFYTAALTSHGYKTVLADSTDNGFDHHAHSSTEAGSQGHVQGRRIGRIAKDVGANIYLDHPSQALVLRIGGQEGAELFRLGNEEGATYEVTIDNGDNGLSPPPHPGNHFGFYYDAIDLNPGEPKILIEPNGGSQVGDCGGLGFGKSHRLGSGD
jgi:hypothetical protein